jgi:hypothetical protein
MIEPSFNQIEIFLCHWKRKLEGYKCSLSTKSKGQGKKLKKRNKRIVIFSLKVFDGKTLNPF